MILEIIKENYKFVVVTNCMMGMVSDVDAEVERVDNGIHPGLWILVWVL